MSYHIHPLNVSIVAKFQYSTLTISKKYDYGTVHMLHFVLNNGKCADIYFKLVDELLPIDVLIIEIKQNMDRCGDLYIADTYDRKLITIFT